VTPERNGSPTAGEIFIVVGDAVAVLARDEAVDCAVRAARILDSGTDFNREQVAVLQEAAELLRPAVSIGAGLDVRIDLPQPARPAIDFLRRQARIRHNYPQRVLRTCRTCAHQTIVNPELQVRTEARQRKQAFGGLVADAVGAFTSGGLAPLARRGMAVLGAGPEAIPFVCPRCKGLEYYDEDATLCPGCHRPTAAPALSCCEHCGRVFTDVGHAESGWAPADRLDLPPPGLVPVATLPQAAGVTSAAYAASLVAFGCADGSARAYKVRDGALEPAGVFQHEVGARPRLARVVRARGLTRWLVVSITNDGERIATGGPDGTVRIWDIGTGGQLVSLDHRVGSALAAGAQVTGISFLGDGNSIVTSTYDGQIRTWDLGSGHVVHSARRSAAAYATAAARGAPVAAAGFGMLAKGASVWESLTGGEVAALPHGADVLALSLTAEGGRAVTGGSDGLAKIWEIASGRVTAVLSHAADVLAVAAASAPAIVATGSGDNTARVWSLETGLELARVPHQSAVTAVAISPDGRYLATGDAGSTTIWSLAEPIESGRGPLQDAESRQRSSAATTPSSSRPGD
jgi:hypothetical protein